MLLHYFRKKENKEKTKAKEQYKKIIELSNSICNQKNLFTKKNYNISFEIVSIYLILFIRINLSKKKYKKNMQINDNLMSLFISDLDKSLREIGIGDMSIGKYVKSYVKKFYFRLKKFPSEYDHNQSNILVQYFKDIKFTPDDNYLNISTEINAAYVNLIKSIK